MFIGAVIVLSYFSYVFITETFSLLPPARFHFSKHNGPRTRRRFLGYWSALCLLGSGLSCAIVLPNHSIQYLLLGTLTIYSLLMLPAAVLYWLMGARAANKTIKRNNNTEHNKINEVPRAQKIQIDYEL